VPITATQTTNNVGFGLDDFVGIGVDPSGNGAQMYYFEVTPRAIRYQQSSESSRYNPPWEASAHVEDGAWTATMIIPLKDLRAGGGANKTWLFNFIRGMAATGEHYTWAYDPLMQDGQPPQWPDFVSQRFWPALTHLNMAIRATRPPARAEIYGLGSFGRDRNVFQQANGTFAAQPSRNYGIDVTYPFTNTMAFVGTLAPDFSNVEVDQQTIAPQEFRRALTEYRPFLAQGAQFFNPSTVNLSFIGPQDLMFYTPGIGTFNRGLKIEGSFGLQSLGLLNVQGPGFDDVAFGTKHQLSDRTFIWFADGVLAHHLNGNDTTAEVGAGGRNLHTGLVYGFRTAMERGTFVPDTGFAHSTDGFLDVHKPNYELLIGYHDVGPYYNPVDGFTLVNDVRGPVYVADFNGTMPSMKNWSIFLTADRYFDRSNRVREADVFGAADVVFKNLIHLNFSQQTSELRTYTTGFPTYAGAVTLPFDLATYTVGYRDGTPSPIDLSYSSGPFATFWLQQFTSSTSRQLGSRLSLSVEYDGTRERFFAGGADSQFLRKIGVGESLGPDTNVSVALRSISGTGGFAQPGLNVAAAFHRRFAGGDELYIDYGTPAAPFTLNRLIVKFVARIGGGAGT
jgi:hypothetical protein